MTATSRPMGIVLVADGDPERGKGIAEACALGGLAVRLVSNGAAALEAALAEPPDVVAATAGLPLVDGVRLASILRANPRTQGLRFLLLGEASGDARSHPAVDARVGSPFDPEAVLRRIEALLARDEGPRARSRTGGLERDLEGKLAQVALADLLQLFHANRKTGTVDLVRRAAGGGEVRGLIAIVDGNVADARCGSVEGEKALHRLLGWRSGSFSFVRSRPAGPPRIHTPTRALLLEGMRQLDELARLRAELPSPDAEVALRVRPDELPPVAQPLTREVLLLLETFSRVGDIVDRSVHPDYQVLRTLHALAERGIIELRRSAAPRDGGSPGTLFSGEQLGRIREWVQRSAGSATSLHDARVCLVGADPAVTSAFLARLAALPEVSIERSFREGRFSTSTLARAGRLGPDAEVGIELFHLPTHPCCEPLWSVALPGALSLLVLVGARSPAESQPLERIAARGVETRGARSMVVEIDPGDATLGLHGPGEDRSLADGTPIHRLPLTADESGQTALARLLAGLVP